MAWLRNTLLVLLLLTLPCEAVAQHLRRANTLYNQGKYKEAIAAYKKAVARGENPTLCYFNLANTYYQTNQLSQAIVYYRASIPVQPGRVRQDHPAHAAVQDHIHPDPVPGRHE